MEKARPWCGQPSGRGWLKNQNSVTVELAYPSHRLSMVLGGQSCIPVSVSLQMSATAHLMRFTQSAMAMHLTHLTHLRIHADVGDWRRPALHHLLRIDNSRYLAWQMHALHAYITVTTASKENHTKRCFQCHSSDQMCTCRLKCKNTKNARTVNAGIENEWPKCRGSTRKMQFIL